MYQLRRWGIPSGGAQEVVMPIFEYICKGCGNKFEAIVFGSKQSECPVCKSTDLAQQLSRFAAHGTDKSSGDAPTMPCGMPEGSCGGGGCGMH
jgi:putative FmdB family regulatory protein